MTDEKLLSIAERFDLEGAIASIKPITFFSARTMRYSPTCPG